MIVPRTREPGPKFKPFALGLGLTAPWLHRPPRPIPKRTHFSAREQALVERIKRLKKEAGSHSPSAWTLAKQIPELRLKVDACFLSNPYATNLFLMHLHREVIRPRKLRALLELYPSQNRVIAAKLGRVLDQEPDSIFVGNGAVEIIQAILHRLTRQKILVNLPTFSPVLRVRPAGHAGRLQRPAQGGAVPFRPRSLSRSRPARAPRHGRPDQPEQPRRRLHPVRGDDRVAGGAPRRPERDRR